MAINFSDNLLLKQYFQYLNWISHRVDMFDSDTGGLSGYYQAEVLPLLSEDTDDDFIETEKRFLHWLCNSKLVVVKCKNAATNENCRIGNNMELLKSSVTNEYKWKCQQCQTLMPLKDRSIFKGLEGNCTLKKGVRALFGWAKGVSVDSLALTLGLRIDTVKTLYKRSTFIIESRHLSLPLTNIVLVDLYPEFARNNKWLLSNHKQIKPILCISQLQTMPQEFWLKSLEFYDKNRPETLKNVATQVVNTVRTKVAAGTTLLLRVAATIPFSDEQMELLKNNYPRVITDVDALSMYNVGTRTLEGALETILKQPLSICEEAQFYSPTYIDDFLVQKSTNTRASGDHFRYLIEILHGNNAIFY